MIVIDLGGDFLKLIAVGVGPVTGTKFGMLGYIAGCMICWTIWGGTTGAFGAAAGGAEGYGRSAAVSDFVQHFFHIKNVSKIPMAKKESKGDEKIQCFDWKGSSRCSSLCNYSLASNAPVLVSLISVAIFVICSASSWLKSWERKLVSGASSASCLDKRKRHLLHCQFQTNPTFGFMLIFLVQC